ncbi:hypothetical protein ACRALDRAFT_207585 [Sodiomyces alcalophilus JCM 7366]|uniref:uncharacterized protein n=1 Tax=Sodiomyces alcalophilus JCM 7366 TaxID=591952 RepID=UPI0039B5E54F
MPHQSMFSFFRHFPMQPKKSCAPSADGRLFIEALHGAVLTRDEITLVNAFIRFQGLCEGDADFLDRSYTWLAHCKIKLSQRRAEMELNRVCSCTMFMSRSYFRSLRVWKTNNAIEDYKSESRQADRQNTYWSICVLVYSPLGNCNIRISLYAHHILSNPQRALP